MLLTGAQSSLWIIFSAGALLVRFSASWLRCSAGVIPFGLSEPSLQLPFLLTHSPSPCPGMSCARGDVWLQRLGPLWRILFTLGNVGRQWLWEFISYISELWTKGPASARTRSSQILCERLGQLMLPASQSLCFIRTAQIKQPDHSFITKETFFIFFSTILLQFV